MQIKCQWYFSGNKCDLRNEREVSKTEGDDLAKSFSLPFFECCALFVSKLKKISVKSNKTESVIIQTTKKKKEKRRWKKLIGSILKFPMIKKK